VKGEFAANAAAKRLGERTGRGWLTYDQAIRELRLEARTTSEIYTASDLDSVAAVSQLTGASTEAYLMGAQEIATAGVATVASPGAANKMGEVVRSSGWWSRFKSFFRRGDAASGRTPGGGKRVHIDIGGEGRYSDAINVNPRTLTTTTGEPGRQIPNLVQALGEKLPFKARVADLITVENTPLKAGAAEQIARVIKPGGEIRLIHPASYAESAHQRVIDAVRGRTTQQTVEGITSTIIIAP
jgi:hypothetical protein